MMAVTLDSRYAGFAALRSPEIAKGVSADAQRISELFAGLIRDAIQSATSVAAFAEPLDELISLYRECAARNWDGQNALPLAESTLREACDLLLLIPPAAGKPSFAPEPTGGVAFEWYTQAKHVLVLSVNGTHSIQYAAILGEGNEAHGRVNFAGSLPKTIHQLLEAYSRA